MRSPNLAAAISAAAGAENACGVGAGCELDRAAKRGWRMAEPQAGIVLDAIPIPHNDPGNTAELIVRPAPNNPASYKLVAEFTNLGAGLQPPLMERAYDVLLQRHRPQATLHVLCQAIAATLASREAERLEVAKAAPRESRPGLGPADAILDDPIGAGGVEKAAVKAGEAIGLGLSPDPPLCFGAGEVAEQLAGDFLGAASNAVRDVRPGDDEVLPVRFAPADEHVAVSLVRVEMAGRDPFQFGLSKVFGDALHDFARVATQVRDAVAVLGRHDQTEVMPVGCPGLRCGRDIELIDMPIKEFRASPIDAGPRPPKISDVRCQRRSTYGSATSVPRHQRFDDDPLPDV